MLGMATGPAPELPGRNRDSLRMARHLPPSEEGQFLKQPPGAKPAQNLPNVGFECFAGSLTKCVLEISASSCSRYSFRCPLIVVLSG